jgi:ketosteroid isomerase-like protein
MSEQFPLPSKPEDIIPSLVERFNSGDVMNQMAMYAPEAVFVANDGRVITDHAEIAVIIGRDIKLGLALNTNVRHLFVADDTVQIILDWSIEGKGPDGQDVHLGGSACDIARRGPDGFWRYLIDNNQGTAVRTPA